jgi:hypothetical protein
MAIGVGVESGVENNGLASYFPICSEGKVACLLLLWDSRQPVSQDPKSYFQSKCLTLASFGQSFSLNESYLECPLQGSRVIPNRVANAITFGSYLTYMEIVVSNNT